MNRRTELDAVLDGIRKSGRRPSLLLHCCCAPCSSAVLEYLSPFFDITADYYNPNITPEQEYLHREEELARLVREMPLGGPVRVTGHPYDPAPFEDAARGLEDCPERGERCLRCYRLRLAEAAAAARDLGCEWFCSTLSVSPLKDAAALNAIGLELGGSGTRWLPSDFKKRGGAGRSIELSRQYGLYRQDYCGCVYSRRDRDARKAAAQKNGAAEAAPPDG